MGAGRSGERAKVYEFALYGVRASGKTCILATLGMPRRPNPREYSCVWLQNAPDHPLPPGNPTEQQAKDPYYRGVQWLREAQERIKDGNPPRLNPSRDDPMRFIFSFQAPHRGKFRIELVDYSGELITDSSGDIASRLRDHMRSCDGILLLTEVPHPERGVAQLTRDFKNLKEAFTILLDQRDARPQQDWPVAVLFNKWDRQGAIDFQDPDGEAARLQEFLRGDPDLPHQSLLHAVEPVVKPENVGRFPVSAYGAYEIRPDGQEVVRMDGPRLQSFCLEDPFVWLADRRDGLDVEQYEVSVNCCSWWQFWSWILGRSPVASARDGARSEDSLWIRFRGVSPLISIGAGIGLQRRLPEQSDLSARVKKQIARSGWLFLAQFLVFLAVLLVLWLGGETSYDRWQYERIVSEIQNPQSKPDDLKRDEDWLDRYARSFFRHLLSRLIVVDRETAKKKWQESIDRREDDKWAPVPKEEDCATKCDLVGEYLREFPSGKYSTEARSLVEKCKAQKEDRENLDYIAGIERDTKSLDPNRKPKDQLPGLEDKARGLLGGLDSLPYPGRMTEKVAKARKDAQDHISLLRQAIEIVLGEDQWEKFRKSYYDLMTSKKVPDAAAKLDKWDPKDPRLTKLVEDFKAQALPIVQSVTQEDMNNRLWPRAHQTVKEISGNPQICERLGPEKVKEFGKIDAEIGNNEDRTRYNEIRHYKPKCEDQITAYLKAADIPHRMERSVERYNAYLAQIRELLDLTITLSQIEWGDCYQGWIWGYEHLVRVTVDGDKHINGTVVPESHKPMRQVGDPLTVHKRLGDAIKLRISIVRKGWWLGQGDADAGQGEYEGALENLNGKTIDCPAQGQVNKVTFTLSGIPAEPDLPKWGEE